VCIHVRSWFASDIFFFFAGLGFLQAGPASAGVELVPASLIVMAASPVRSIVRRMFNDAGLLVVCPLV